MSGGDPPPPPSRPPYLSWHARQPHRRRAPNLPTPSSRPAWAPRRSRSPPPSFRVRRLPHYKQHRYAPHSPPAASPSPHPSFHPHTSHPPPVPRSLHGRLRSPPPRTPPRRPDHPPHRPLQHSYRPDHTISHRPDHFDRHSFRPLDHLNNRTSFQNSRTGPPPFRSDHRPPSDHHSSYRPDHNPAFRPDLPARRDEYDSRRVDNASSRGDSHFAPRIRPLHGKIYKPRKLRTRRLPPHLTTGMRYTHSSLPSPDSPVFSRVGDRFNEAYRNEGRLATSPVDRKGTLSPPRLSTRSGAEDATQTQKGPTPNSTATRSPPVTRDDTTLRQLLVQPPPTKATVLPSTGKPAVNGFLPENGSPDSKLRGMHDMSAGVRKDLREDQCNPLSKCNSTSSPAPNGKTSPMRTETRMSSDRDIGKKKETLGGKLGSLALALTSQTLPEPPIHISTPMSISLIGREKPKLSSNGNNDHSISQLVNLSATLPPQISPKHFPVAKAKDGVSKTFPKHCLDKIPSLHDFNAVKLKERCLNSLPTPRKPVITSQTLANSFVAPISRVEHGRSPISAGKSVVACTVRDKVSTPRENIFFSSTLPEKHSSIPAVEGRPAAVPVAQERKFVKPTAVETKLDISRQGEKSMLKSTSFKKNSAFETAKIHIRVLSASTENVSESFIPKLPVSLWAERQNTLRTSSPKVAASLPNIPGLRIPLTSHPPNMIHKSENISVELSKAQNDNRCQSTAQLSTERPVSTNLKRNDAFESIGNTSCSSPMEVVREDCVNPSAEPTVRRKPDISMGSEFPPISVPAPALSLLRSSPRARKRVPVTEKLSSTKTLVKSDPCIPLPTPPTPHEVITSIASRNELTSKMRDVEQKITSLERTMGGLQTANEKPGQFNLLETKTKATTKGFQNQNSTKTGHYAAIANEILTVGEKKTLLKRSKPSPVPMHAAFRLLYTHNRAKAAASNAELKTMCSHPEVGLFPSFSRMTPGFSDISDEVLRKVALEVKRCRHAALERRQRLAREYSSRRESWVRRLKAARDKRSREKREATRERDRFLLLSTKGNSALLTQRTSSGRTSTKILPSISPNGNICGTTGLDSQLAEIQAAGGTPGFDSIWSKTLASIPDQGLTVWPTPCSSVLVADPIRDFHLSRAVNPWCIEEKLIFLEKYLAYPKNFRKISGFLTYKSSRDCSYFYYVNKINLGLKQLTKDYYSLKRKGILREHLIEVARRYTSNTVPNYTGDIMTKEKADEIIAGAGVSSDDFGLDNTPSQMRNWLTDLPIAPMKRSERILVDSGWVDLSGIDRNAFVHALAVHGHDWKAISLQLRLKGKSSTHFREFFRQQRRKLENEALLLQKSEKLPSSLRRSQGVVCKAAPRLSARALPKLKLKSSNSTLQLDGLRNKHNPVSSANGSVLNKGCRNVERMNAGCEHEGKLGLTDLEDAENGKNESELKRNRPTCVWTSEEQKQFKSLFHEYGRNWKTIARLMAPKTPAQVKGFWLTVAEEVGDGQHVNGGKSQKMSASGAEPCARFSDGKPVIGGKAALLKHGGRNMGRNEDCIMKEE